MRPMPIDLRAVDVFRVICAAHTHRSDWRSLQSFARAFVNAFTISPNATRIGIVQFSTYARTELSVSYGTSKSAVLSKIDTVSKMGGGTVVESGFRQAYADLSGNQRAAAAKVVVLIGDTAGRAQAEADRMKSIGWEVFAVQIESLVDSFWSKSPFGTVFGNTAADFQKLVSTPASTHHLKADSYSALPSIASKLANQTCDVIPTSPPAPPAPPYMPPSGAVCQIDATLVIDGSGSINSAEWREARNFAKDFLNGLDIAGGVARLAITQFSTTARVEVSLKDGSNQKALEWAIDNMRQFKRSTNVETGLRVAHDDMKLYVRPDAGKVIVLVADGGNARRAQSRADVIKGDGVTVITVGVGNGVKEADLRRLASPGNSYFSATNYADLKNVVQRILDESCKVTAPPATPQPPATTTFNPGNLLRDGAGGELESGATGGLSTTAVVVGSLVALAVVVLILVGVGCLVFRARREGGSEQSMQMTPSRTARASRYGGRSTARSSHVRSARTSRVSRYY